ncbi:nuclear transport factor 2 family protein [Zhouia amylolytica]|nr:hypothetical protein [Zhouia amylolytica]
MKTIHVFVVMFVLLLACEQEPKQYFSSAPEIDLAKSNTESYYSGNWEAFRANYVDTAKIYHNSTEAITVDEMIMRFKDGLKDVSTYSSKDSIYYEMIVEDDGDHWINMWATWSATFKNTGEKVEVPYHITAMIKDGKIIKEFGYWNHLPIYQALKKSRMQMDTTNTN